MYMILFLTLRVKRIITSPHASVIARSQPKQSKSMYNKIASLRQLAEARNDGKRLLGMLLYYYLGGVRGYELFARNCKF